MKYVSFLLHAFDVICCMLVFSFWTHWNYFYNISANNGKGSFYTHTHTHTHARTHKQTNVWKT